MRATPKYATNPKLLQAHPVLSRLLSLKQAMASLERLDFGPNSDGDVDDEMDSEDSEEDMRFLWGDRDLAEMDEAEFRELIREAQELNSPQPKEKKEKKKSDGRPNGESKNKKSKSSSKEKGKKSKKPVFDLEEPEFIPASELNGTSSSNTKSKSKSKSSPHSTSAFGEYTSLDATDAQDKSARKRTLRFHTSKIESASNRRAKARGAAMGGDDDIPYKEREKAKEARMAAESARKMERGLLGQGGEDLEDVQEARGVKRAREEDDEGEMGVDGYYELVKRQKRDQRDEKKALYDAQKAAEKYVSVFLFFLGFCAVVDRVFAEPLGRAMVTSQRMAHDL
jgi:U3 small nucleolar RNA-associated protein 3